MNRSWALALTALLACGFDSSGTEGSDGESGTGESGTGETDEGGSGSEGSSGSSGSTAGTSETGGDGGETTGAEGETTGNEGETTGNEEETTGNEEETTGNEEETTGNEEETTGGGCTPNSPTGGGCGPGEFCQSPPGQCGAQEGECMGMPAGCEDIWMPVCGCNGQTYGNECEAQSAGMSVDYLGECEGATTGGGGVGDPCEDASDCESEHCYENEFEGPKFCQAGCNMGSPGTPWVFCSTDEDCCQGECTVDSLGGFCS